MKYRKKGDFSTIVYNPHVTVTGIPAEAQRYVVNGRPAIDWVLDRQQVKTDKKSGITNDPNDWATETMNNPRYPLDLLLRVVTVSLETMKVVDGLPELRTGREADTRILPSEIKRSSIEQQRTRQQAATS